MQPAIATNNTTTPITIEKFDFTSGAEYFDLSDLIGFPRRIPPGEAVTIAYACFRPEDPNKEYDAAIQVVSSSGKIRTTEEIRMHAVSFSEPKISVTPATIAGAIIDF